MLDVRKYLSNLLDQASHKVVYIRRDTRFRCECFSERSGESASNCPKCFGTGYKVSFEVQRTRQKPNSVPLSLAGVNQNTPFGKVAPYANVYYFEHFVNPIRGDLVVEVKWENDKPKEIVYKQVISLAEAKIGQGGRVEFYHVYTKFDLKGENDHVSIS